MSKPNFLMSWLKVVVIFVFLFSCVKAQDSSKDNVVNPLHPSMRVVLIVLLIMFIFTFLIVAYAKFCYRPLPDTQLGNEQDPRPILTSRARFSGIDKAVIESIPFFRFSSLKGSKDGLECAVCLSRFEEPEILRLLPKCKHAFHIGCIDKWLESHSSCPLCRYKFDGVDLKSLSYTSSLRYPTNSFNLTDEPNLEIFVERESNSERSSRFNIASILGRSSRSNKDEFLLQKSTKENVGQEMLHKHKHKIIVADVICKSRWSDVNSSDLMFLSSEMLNDVSSKRFSQVESDSGRFIEKLSAKEHILQIKNDIEKKRMCDSKLDKIMANSSPSVDYGIDVEETSTSRSINLTSQRSVSEITNVSRFTTFGARSRTNGSASPLSTSMDDRVRRLWLPIARRTIQWFAGQEPTSRTPRGSVNV